MEKRRVILSGAVIAALALTFQIFYSPEPKFNGRNLSHWLSILTSGPGLAPKVIMGAAPLGTIPFPQKLSGQEYRQAQEAVRHIGSDAIPSLVELLKTKDSRLKKLAIKLLKQQQKFKITLLPDHEYRQRGLAGFQILQEQAAPAVPMLAKLLQDRELMEDASQALGAIGSEGVWPFAEALKHRDAAMRINAATALSRYFRNSASTVVPLLAVAVKDEDIRVRQLAIVGLGQIVQEPAIAVPALVQCLKDPKVPVRILALESLANYRNAAQAAIPEVTECLDDPAVEVRHYAAATLRKIR